MCGSAFFLFWHLNQSKTMERSTKRILKHHFTHSNCLKVLWKCSIGIKSVRLTLHLILHFYSISVRRYKLNLLDTTFTYVMRVNDYINHRGNLGNILDKPNTYGLVDFFAYLQLQYLAMIFKFLK